MMMARISNSHSLLFHLFFVSHLVEVAVSYNYGPSRNASLTAEKEIIEYNGTVYLIDDKMVFKEGVIDKVNGVAYGSFKDGLLITGWGVLGINSGSAANPATGRKYSDSDIMTAAGYLEAGLTWRQIYSHSLNTMTIYQKSNTPKMKAYFRQQQKWMESQVLLYPTDPFWKGVGLILNQYMGLFNGYNAVAPPDMKLELNAFQILNYYGDLLDLVHVIDKNNRPDFASMTRDELETYTEKNSHCSALIKVLPGYENIYYAHDTWTYYQITNRIYKFYNFSIADFSSKAISFSSYPGFLESLDDFYILGNGLVMLETSNTIYNTSLYDLITPKSAPAWVRVRVASHMASTPLEWAEYFKQHNSGTYNNQYMILDLNRIKLRETIEDGALYIIEQIPGLVEYSDQTAILRLGYWPSYNKPFHETIYNMSGYPEIVASRGVDFSYELAPRAKIFRREAGKVTDMDSMKRLMRYNDYKSDPYAEDNPCDTICCRRDLRSEDPDSYGCFDTKVSDYHLGMAGSVQVISGPTTSGSGDGTDLKPFTWSDFPNSSHLGLPPKYNFDFIMVKPPVY